MLRDEEILVRYEAQRSLLTQEIGRLITLPLDRVLFERLQQLTTREKNLYQRLKMPPAKQSADGGSLHGSERLSELVHSIPFEVTRMIAQESSAMNKQISHVRRLLLWQSAALIPLALLIAVIFSVLISRPLRRLGKAIRQLGSGQFTTPIEVVGPQDIRELGEELDWLRRQLAALDEHKLQFLHNISHELKTPLAAIREGTGLLRDGIAERYVEIIADKGINDVVEVGIWSTVVNDFISKVKIGQHAEGFLVAIDDCGSIWAKHFPAKVDNVNELPDHLVEL